MLVSSRTAPPSWPALASPSSPGHQPRPGCCAQTPAGCRGTACARRHGASGRGAAAPAPARPRPRRRAAADVAHREQEAVAADLLHHLGHLPGDGVAACRTSSTEPLDCRGSCASPRDQRLLAATRLKCVQRLLVAVGVQSRGTGASRSNFEKSMLVILPKKASSCGDLLPRPAPRAPRPRLGFVHGLAEDRVDQEQHLHVVGIAARRRRARRGHRRDRPSSPRCPWRGDDGVGMARGELRPRGEPPAWAITGRPCGQAPSSAARGCEYLPLEIDRMDLGVVDQHAALAVGDDGAGLPACPTARCTTCMYSSAMS